MMPRFQVIPHHGLRCGLGVMLGGLILASGWVFTSPIEASMIHSKRFIQPTIAWLKAEGKGTNVSCPVKLGMLFEYLSQYDIHETSLINLASNANASASEPTHDGEQDIALQESDIALLLGQENFQKLTYLLMQPSSQHELLVFQAIGDLENGQNREKAMSYIHEHVEMLSLFEMAMIQGLHPTKQVAQSLEKRFIALQNQTPEPAELSVFLSIASLAETQSKGQQAENQKAQSKVLLTTLEKLSGHYLFQLDELVTLVVLTQRLGFPEHTLFWQQQLMQKLDQLSVASQEQAWDEPSTASPVPASTTEAPQEDDALLIPEEAPAESHHSPPLPAQ
ncbi:MAG: hypothetical protein ACKO37_03135 [Vampirovibrionales bacterium]